MKKGRQTHIQVQGSLSFDIHGRRRAVDWSAKLFFIPVHGKGKDMRPLRIELPLLFLLDAGASVECFTGQETIDRIEQNQHCCGPREDWQFMWSCLEWKSTFIQNSHRRDIRIWYQFGKFTRYANVPTIFKYYLTIGQPALYCAARQGHSAIVLELLNSRAIKKNIIVEQHGGTALHGILDLNWKLNISGAVTGQHLEVIALLLVAGVDDTITNKLGTIWQLFIFWSLKASRQPKKLVHLFSLSLNCLFPEVLKH